MEQLFMPPEAAIRCNRPKGLGWVMGWTPPDGICVPR